MADFNNMTESQIKEFIKDNYPAENSSCEWKEFKNLKNSFSGDESKDVVSYVSAIANMQGGELVIGVVDKTLEIAGTNTYNFDKYNIVYKLKEQCTNLSSEGLYVDELIAIDSGKKVWIIHIPKHLPRRPVYAHRKAWQRIEDSLVEMTPERMDAILSEPIAHQDWSAQIIPEASIDDLDPAAILEARKQFVSRYPEKEDEVKQWDDEKFLNKAGITIKGKITNTAIILLGRPESEHFISPAVCKIRWSRKNASGESNSDFDVFTIPMILAVEKLKNTIHNSKYVFSINGSLFPDEMPRYDAFTLREPLNNCIAHQDYSKSAMIEVIEYYNDRLIFRNFGQFIPNSVEDVVMEDCPESQYRNPFLVSAMKNVKMVETEGGGIRKLYERQRRKFFPMPEYDLSGGKVKVEIQGNILDEEFAKILISNPSLTLHDIILLDKVQKHKPLTDDEITMLRKKHFVEGRKNNLYLSSMVVKPLDNNELKSNYIRNKSFDDDFYKKLIVEYLSKFGQARRKDIDTLLMSKLSESLTQDQKFNKITNLLASLRQAGIIQVKEGSRIWILVKSR
jgi:ATP-dependent DNA helicase RecG